MAPKAAAPAAKKSGKKYTPKKNVAPTTPGRSVAPGTVAIMLAGKYRGRHCVVLKKLGNDGALVVSGPFKYNGIPIRRVNQRYIIATSTKIGVDAKAFEAIDVKTFKRQQRVKKGKKSAKSFLTAKQARVQAKAAGKKRIPDERVALQKKTDAAIIAAIKKDPNAKVLPGYLRSVFTVKPGDAPHRMKF